jgi:hypothetical protein
MKAFKLCWVILFISALLFCQACVPSTTYHHETGARIDPDKVSRLIEGKTTEAEAVALFGPPQNIIERPDGSKILVYMHMLTQTYGRPSLADTKGSYSHNTLYLGIRNGVVMKKWQQASNMPTRSVFGQTMTVPDEYK